MEARAIRLRRDRYDCFGSPGLLLFESSGPPCCASGKNANDSILEVASRGRSGLWRLHGSRTPMTTPNTVAGQRGNLTQIAGALSRAADRPPNSRRREFNGSFLPEDWVHNMKSALCGQGLKGRSFSACELRRSTSASSTARFSFCVNPVHPAISSIERRQATQRAPSRSRRQTPTQGERGSAASSGDAQSGLAENM